jgi:thiopurine S-methyltransferase
VNEDLLRCLPALDAVKSSVPAGRRPRIFLPLCGASVDILYLQQQGWHVIGLDAVRQPLQAFVNAHREQLGDVRGEDSDHVTAQHLDLFCMDLFSPELTAEVLGGAVDAVWDRGSLVAIGVQQRVAYVSKIVQLLSRREKEANWLLNVFDYNTDSKFVAPPHTLPRPTVEQLLSAHASRIELLHSVDGVKRWPGVEGLTRFDVQTYAVTISK